MQKSRNFYDVLQMSDQSPGEEIKKRLLKLILIYHPDKKTGNGIILKDLVKIKEVLLDKNRRTTYHTFLDWQKRNKTNMTPQCYQIAIYGCSNEL